MPFDDDGENVIGSNEIFLYHIRRRCMKTLAFLILTLIIGLFPAVAQDTSSAARMDTMLIYQRALMEMQQKIYEEVHYQEPLAGKTAGIELNIARLLVSTGQDYFTLSGTFSLFNVSRSAELAFPVFYQHGTKSNKESFSNNSYDVPLTLLNLDATYRQFLGSHHDGFYFSGGIRYTYIKGIEGTDFILFSLNSGGPEVLTQKVGAYFGIGYRYFTKSGFYWGTGLIYGRYFSNDERDIQEVTFDDSKIILDFELLKFGYAF